MIVKKILCTLTEQNRGLRMLSLLLSTVLLSSCLDLNQQLTVRDANHATISTKMAIETAILEMSSIKPDSREFCSQESAPNIEGIEATISQYNEGSMTVCKTTAQGSLEAVSEWLSKSDTLLEEGPNDEHDFSLSLEPYKNDYRFSMKLSKQETLNEDQVPDAFTKAAEAMVKAAVAGHSLNWSVTAPKIIATTGRLSEDGKTAKFSVPLAKLIDQQEQAYEFEVVFSEDTGLMAWFNRLIDYLQGFLKWFKELFV